MGLLIFLSLAFISSINALEDPFLLGTPSPISNSSSVFGNPAGMSLRQGSRTTLGTTIENSDELSGLWLSYQGKYMGSGYRYSETNSQSEFVLCVNSQEFNGLSLGAGLNYVTGDNIRNIISDLGLQITPFQYLKAGYYTRGMIQGNTDNAMEHNAALGIRPLAFLSNHAEAFTAGYQFQTSGFNSNSWDRGTHSVFADVRLFKWLHLQGRKEIQNGDGFYISSRLQISPNGLLGYNTNRAQSGAKTDEYLLQFHSKYKENSWPVPGKIVELNFNKSIVEGNVTRSWFSGKNKISHLDALEQLNQLKTLKGVKVVIINLEGMSCPWSIATDIRNKLLEIKNSGIKVIVYLESVSTLKYYLASSASRIVMSPASYFNVKGFASEAAFLKGLMDKVGVEAQFIRHGDYKSFPEVFTREDMSEEWKSNLQSILNSLWENFLNDVADARNLSLNQLKAALKNPELSIAAAISYGLIDTSLYEDQIKEFALDKQARIYRPVYEGPLQENWASGADVAVVSIDGAISSGKSKKGGFFFSSSTGSFSIAAQLRNARLNNSFKAVIIRIDSPGGSAVASDVIRREVDLLREAKKPVIISIGNTCASGGYYIASGGDVIIAGGNAILGSIGIFGGKLILKGLYDKLGIKKEILLSSPHADASSDYRHWDSLEVQSIQSYIDSFYSQFVKVVAEGRNLPEDSVDFLAQGKIYTGLQARDNGLIDKIGGWEEALKTVKSKIGIKDSDHIKLVFLSQEEYPFSAPPYSKARLISDIKEDFNQIYKSAASYDAWAFSPEAFILDLK